MDHLDTGVVDGTVLVYVLADRMLEWQTQNTGTLGCVFAAVESFAASCSAVHLQVAQGSTQDYHDFLQEVEESV
jgi:hypothetical protein